MLFGTEELQKKLMEEVMACEKEKHMKVVYGALVGSISKGLQLIDSDYDTRFLYINENFPNPILYPDKLPEKEVIYRKYLGNTCFEKIPFWEMTSFLQYMIYPSINGKFSTGLYNVVGWTYLSPYVWDPYGLQNKLLPLIQKFFFKDYYIDYHKTILDNILEEQNGVVIAKEYLNILYSALAIDYADKYNHFPPVYMRTLSQCISDEISQVVDKWICEIQKMARGYIYDNKITGLCHKASVEIKLKREKIIDEYIDKIRKKFRDFNMNCLKKSETDIL